MNEAKQSAFYCRKKSKQEEEQLRKKTKKEFHLAVDDYIQFKKEIGRDD